MTFPVTILGAAGNLGRHLVEEFGRAGHGVQALTRAELDLGTEGAREHLMAYLTAHGTKLVVNCAAYTDVDGAEREETQAFLSNALGAERAAQAAEATGARLIHLSTDFVFSGRFDGEAPRPYDEFDRPAPQSIYARSKYAGEELVRAQSPQAAIVRVEGLYGRGGKNFVSTLARRLKAGQALRVDNQRRVTPTSCRALARQLLLLGQSEVGGIYHATCQGETTWFGFATALCDIAEELGHPLTRSFVGVETAELQSPAPRPAYSVLECRMLRLRGLLIMPDWREALHAYLLEVREANEL